MSRRGAVGTFTFAMTLGITAFSNVAAMAAEARYPDLEGAWDHLFRPLWSVGEPGNKPPLTPEYMKVFEADQADMAAGGLGAVPSSGCVPTACR